MSTLSIARRKQAMRLAAGLIAAGAVASGAQEKAADVASDATVANLRCEYRVDPLGVDVVAPRLSWIFASEARGARQTAYEIAASSTAELLEKQQLDVWDSGRVASDRTNQITYGGKALRSGQQVFWKVRAWDERGAATEWSNAARFTMGLLDASDWKAKWIAAPPPETGKADPYVTVLLRRDFELTKPIVRALAFVCGLGQYELEIDGTICGDDRLAPGWTQYGKTSLYDTIDVTNRLRNAPAHCVALTLGNGMYDMAGDSRGSQQQRSFGRPCAIVQVDFEHADGSHELVVSDERWRVHAGPTTYSGVFGGEDWDARLDPSGWDRAGFDASIWIAAQVVAGPGGRLAGLTHSAPPIVVHEFRKPVAVKSPKPNVQLFDLGQNAPYVPKLTAVGAAGTTIRLWPAEVLKPDGTIEQATMRPGKHVSYTLRGSTREAPEIWWPKFWFCGSRYWQAEAFDAANQPLSVDSVLVDFRGLRLHSATELAGDFECSDELFNKIKELIVRAMRSNFSSVISDCPHREKSAWLEQDHLVGPGLLYAFDMAPLFTKTVHDIADAQQPNGMVPTMAPEYFIYEKGFRDSVEWGGACVFLPDLMRTWLGDDQVVRESASVMRRYVDYLGTCAKEGLLASGLGDWDGNGNDARTPVAITDTAYWFLAARTLSHLLESTGDDGGARAMNDVAAQVRASFRKSFVDSATGKVATGSQSAQATALDLGLIDADEEPRAFAQLLADLEAHQFAISCGEVGHPSLLRTLAAHGRSDLVWRLHHQSERPGYGWQVAHGETTLAETWDASPISHNHFMLGHILEWFFGWVAGIQPDPAAPGFRHFILRPTPVGELTWARAHYDSIAGRIESAWTRDADGFTLEVTIPANTSATLILPTSDPASVVEGDGAAAKTLGVRLVRTEPGAAVFEVAGGRYRFHAR